MREMAFFNKNLVGKKDGKNGETNGVCSFRRKSFLRDEKGEGGTGESASGGAWWFSWGRFSKKSFASGIEGKTAGGAFLTEGQIQGWGAPVALKKVERRRLKLLTTLRHRVETPSWSGKGNLLACVGVGFRRSTAPWAACAHGERKARK